MNNINLEFTFRKDKKRLKVFLELSDVKRGVVRDYETLEEVAYPKRLSIYAELFYGRTLEAAGQILDVVYNSFSDNFIFRILHLLWKEYHLNDLHAGTKQQEFYLKLEGLLTSDKYEKAVEYLKRKDLYEDRGYVYASGWLYKRIEPFALEIIKLLQEFGGKLK